MEGIKKTFTTPQAVLLDWDGTLVNSMQGIFEAHNHVRVYMGNPAWTWEEYKGFMRSSSRELYPKLYGDRSQEAMDVLYEYYGAHHLQGLEELPDAANLLAAIHALNIPMGVVSNKKHEMLVREAKHLGWDRYFGGAMVGAGVAAKDKPAPEPVHMALDIMKIKPDQGLMWYIGDTITDLQVAKAANCNAVLVLHGENKDDLISEFSPYLVVADCGALIQILAQK